MKHFTSLAVCLHLIMLSTTAQKSNLPLKVWSAASPTPFVFYISGDGGFNNFSTDLCGEINKSGYSLTALNAKSYFWDKKTPEKTVADISSYLESIFQGRPNQQLVLIGYSFGADVMPFIVNRLPDTLKKRLLLVVLLSASTSTDFEVHWSDIFGGGGKRSMDVVKEINKMIIPKTVTLFGSDETDFPVKDISLKNYSNEYLPGGHHYGGNISQLTKTILKYFR